MQRLILILKAEITQKDADVLSGAESYTDSEITEHNTSESSHSDRTAVTEAILLHCYLHRVIHIHRLI